MAYPLKIQGIRTSLSHTFPIYMAMFHCNLLGLNWVWLWIPALMRFCTQQKRLQLRLMKINLHLTIMKRSGREQIEFWWYIYIYILYILYILYIIYIYIVYIIYILYIYIIYIYYIYTYCTSSIIQYIEIEHVKVYIMYGQRQELYPSNRF